MPNIEEITYDAKESVRNEYDFRRELLSALKEDFSSNNEVKDTESYRQHILHALGQEFDQDDIKQTNNFRAKVVDGVKELVNGGGGGGGGDFNTADATLIFNTNEPLSIADLAYIDPTYGNDLLTGDPQINTNRTLKVVLYKGASAWFTMEGRHDAQIVTSGAITNRDGIYNITGACTITINAG